MEKKATWTLFSYGSAFEIVKSAKILGVTIKNELKWNDQVHNITAKVSRRIKHADIDSKSLIQCYCACICSVLEYALQLTSLFEEKRHCCQRLLLGLAVSDIDVGVVTGADPGKVKWVNFHPPPFFF